MTIAEFIQRLREDFLDDTTRPYYWSDETLIRYANDAEREACKRSDLLIDSTTPEVCFIDVIAGQSEYVLHPSVLYILHAVNVDEGYPLEQIDLSRLDSTDPMWRIRESENPNLFMINEPSKIVIVPKPIKNFKLNLTVSRLPLTYKKKSDSFEIDEKFHEGLLFWAAFLALNMCDINTNRKALAPFYEAQFERYFGTPKSAYTEVNRKRIPRSQVMRPVSKVFGFP